MNKFTVWFVAAHHDASKTPLGYVASGTDEPYRGLIILISGINLPLYSVQMNGTAQFLTLYHI
jgi:hypothetical protein